MGLDIRIPIGMMFGIIGVAMLLYGLSTGSDPMYARSLGMNVNIGWGAFLAVFGAVMLFFARKSAKEQPKA